MFSLFFQDTVAVTFEGKLIKFGEVKGVQMPKPGTPMGTQSDTHGDLMLVLCQDIFYIVKIKR